MCDSALTIRVFPALLKRRETLSVEELRAEAGESNCSYHASKRASTACSHCGRFICALCDMQFAGVSWCPACLANMSQRKQGNLDNHRVLYDSIALGIATLPALLLFWPVFAGGPVALYWSVRYWKRPLGIVRRNRWRFVVAIVLGSAEVAFLGLMIFAVLVAKK